MGIWKLRPVMTAGTVTALLSAIYGVCVAFDIYDFTEAQTTAVAGLIATVALFFNKAAATNVFVQPTVDRMMAEGQAVAGEAVRQRNEANDLAREAMAVAAQAHGRPVAVGNVVPLNPAPPAGPVGGRDPNSEGNT